MAVKRDIPERQNPRDREGSRVLGVRGVGREMSGGVGPSFQIGVGFRRNNSGTVASRPSPRYMSNTHAKKPFPFSYNDLGQLRRDGWSLSSPPDPTSRLTWMSRWGR